ncbi:MAG: glutamate--cysteine ligase [Streptomyces sp.]|jgi:glutamate--cysteine ligase|nr:glutamate--cysteine ligase [Streptomyces sp.]
MSALTHDEAEAHIGGVCFKTGPPGKVGVELEWLVHDRSDALLAVPSGRLDEILAPLAALGALPFGSRLTREPGGQLELSSPAAATIADGVHAAATDLAVVRQTLAARGVTLAGSGLDPYRDPRRVLDEPRYRAMEKHFDRIGPWGRMMMRGTAAIQVNLDTGDDTDRTSGYRYRWELAHRLGPVLVAAFANSPLWHGKPTGWRSTRQAVWDRLDPGRTHAPRYDPEPRDAWTRYALDAPLLCVRNGAEATADWTAPAGLTFRSWLQGTGHGLRPPTLEDLDYHLSTLFPPVRPRGWLELRMIDAQPGDGWIVAAALATVLLDDPGAAAAAWEATEPLCQGQDPLPAHEVWVRAARNGPADPEIGKSVLACFAAAESALSRCAVDAPLRSAVADFAQRYAERGRCPADDQLDALRRAAAPITLENPW